MKTYIVRTHAGRDFDNWYNNAGVIDIKFEENGTIAVLEVQVEDWYASAYESALDTDGAVISYEEV